MIEKFELNIDQQYQGRIGPGNDTHIDIKRSTDLRVSGRSDWRSIDSLLQNSLGQALGLLSGLHPFFQKNRLNDIGYNMQRTNPGEFYHWHVDSGPGDFTKRQLVAIWYLNDAPSIGGETEFYFQQVSVKPTAGMLLLFPPFWTHLHRGKTVEQGHKYIATTWVCVA
ncbi:MAG: 2OG-Fe(II) oxygenase [Gammaproteobacteria bacterium]|nr:2OG-Fe(II) oxygenase [Gammaproteobacteria bacterium]